MAGAEIILSRLCDLQATSFEVVDCKVKEDEIVWHIQHKLMRSTFARVVEPLASLVTTENG